MKRNMTLAELQQKFDAECVVDTTDWDTRTPGQLFEVWTRNKHERVDGVCIHCGDVDAGQRLVMVHPERVGADAQN